FAPQWGKARVGGVGGGPEDYRAGLLKMSDALGLSDALHWAGPRGDLPAVHNALDVFTLSSSFGEGFPNALGEAMACGTPCVATDVGDAARIAGKEGRVVEPGNPEALAGAWLEIARMDAGQRREAGRRAVERIQEHFTLARMIEETEVCLTNL
ncbi:MAG: glycosyltransferase, partial [SAR324 cluster bacterium]|nr:glycosyltransferase [SAR324 cluster bacterium]